MSYNNVCAPGKYDNTNNTCFTLQQLVELCSAYNRYISKKNLNPANFRINNVNNDFIKIKQNKSYLLHQLSDRFKNVCGNDQACITHQSFMNELVSDTKKDIENNVFRNKGPNGSTNWLSNIHIDGIMKQYENVYPDFQFLGAVAADCVTHPMCDLYGLDFEHLCNDGKNRVGIVYNLDTYGNKGSHWVATYINIKNGDFFLL